MYAFLQTMPTVGACLDTRVQYDRSDKDERPIHGVLEEKSIWYKYAAMALRICTFHLIRIIQHPKQQDESFLFHLLYFLFRFTSLRFQLIP